MENWSWIEVVWTLVAVIGAYFSANNIKDGITDLQALNKIGVDHSLEEKILRITAWGNIRRDSLRETIQVMFLFLGIIVGFNAPSPGGTSLLGIIVQAVFITCSSALTVSAIGDHFDRTRIQKLGEVIELKDDGV